MAESAGDWHTVRRVGRFVSPGGRALSDDGSPLFFGLASGDADRVWNEQAEQLEEDLLAVVNFGAFEALVVCDAAQRSLKVAIDEHRRQVIEHDDDDESSLIPVLVQLYAYLMSVVSIVDQCAAELSTRFPGDPETVKRFRAETNRLHADSAEYRLVYALRNYASHQSVPLVEEAMAYSEVVSTSAGERPIVVYDVECDRDTLLEKGTRLASREREWISAQPATFPIWPLIHGSFRVLLSIVMSYQTELAPGVIEAGDRSSAFLDLFARQDKIDPARVQGKGFLTYEEDAERDPVCLGFTEIPVDRYDQMMQSARAMTLNNPDAAIPLNVTLPVGLDSFDFQHDQPIEASNIE